MLITAILLLTLSCTVIYSSSPQLAIQQIIYSLVGFGLYYLLWVSDYRALKGLIKYAYFLVIIMLIITFLLGVETRGSIRWIPIGPFNLQPSEFAKPVIVLALSYFWSKHPASWLNILKSLGILLPVAFLIFRQPDLGTTLTVVFIWAALLIASNISLLKIGILALIGSIATPGAWFLLKDYQRARFISFLSPNLDPQGIGFHVIQSMIAVGSGEFLGRGLGRGTQSRLQFLPEFRTDFIFAFISEELGFLGSMIVLFLYAAIFYFMFRILVICDDRFGELVVIGVMSMLFFQIVVNVGMNMGVLPITGITLPLLSYGGSSVITILISMGLIASVDRYGTSRKKVDTLGVFSHS